MILLHGWLGQGEDWLDVVPALSEHYFCIFPDLPGHGNHTPLDDTQPLSFETIAASLLAELETEFALKSWHLGGYSMGGRLALSMALERPEAIKSLILEGCHPGIRNEETRSQRSQLDQQRAKEILEGGLDDFIERWYDMPLFASLHEQPVLHLAMKKVRKRNHAPSVARMLGVMSPGRQPNYWERVTGFQAPTCLLAGALDPKYPALMQEMADVFPQAQVHIAPNAGHNVHAESPQWWSDTVLTFLQSTEEDPL